ncbi:MAG: enoyl-CoA hydratase-related protein, partial [Acidobacteriota bacterium]|nr:enoyl-CoA hydratase-related protein [Acidobacteriota bacterium]
MSEAAFEFLKIQIDSHIGWLTIDRPKKLNALNRRVMEEIDAAVADAIDDGSVGVLVITGSGEKAFVAGADIAEMASMDPAEAQRFSGFLQRVLARIERSPKPVIAAVNGFALGGGCELALACHLRIAAENARFGQPEVGLGLMPGAGGTIRLPRI